MLAPSRGCHTPRHRHASAVVRASRPGVGTLTECLPHTRSVRKHSDGRSDAHGLVRETGQLAPALGAGASDRNELGDLREASVGVGRDG